MAKGSSSSILKVRPPLLQRTFTSLRYRDYRWLWLGSCTEHIGEFMELGAILWLVNEMTGNPFILTLVGACRFFPMIFISFIGGVATDRFNRKKLLVATLFAFSLISAILGLLVLTDLVRLWHILVIALLYGALTSFNHPARASIVPNLVKKEHLLNAISLDATSVMAARLVAMLIAGFIIAAAGVVPVFFLRVVGTLLAIFWLSWVKVPKTPPEARRKDPWKNLIEGIKYVTASSIILILVSLYLIHQFANQTYTNFLPIYAVEIFKVGAVGYGLLQAAPGLGSVAGLIFLASIGSGKHKGWLLFSGGLLLGLALIAFGFTPWFIPSLIVLIIVGGMTTAFMAISTTLIQQIIPDEVRGRVMGLREIAFGLGPVFSLIIGGIAVKTGVSIATALLGVICFCAVFILMLVFPKIRRLD